MAEQIHILTEKVTICPRIPSEIDSSSQDHETAGGCNSTCPPNVTLSPGKSQQGLICPPFAICVHEQPATRGEQAVGYFTACVTLIHELGTDKRSSPSARYQVLRASSTYHLKKSQVARANIIKIDFNVDPEYFSSVVIHRTVCFVVDRAI